MKGITPAYAGKSCIRLAGLPIAWDHPRVCGEKKFFKTEDEAKAGSPPHMRGKERAKTTAALQTRITPAYAGKRQVLEVKDSST